MRKLLILLLLTGIVLPAVAAKRITVEQLERLLAAAHGKADAKVARQLSELELTERLGAARLSRWEAALPGAESRRSLVVLADMSAFLEPPAMEVPAAATPDLAAQRQIMALAVGYATKTMHQLPNFFATRDTIRFEDTPRQLNRGSVDGSFTTYQPLHPVARSSATTLYRDGREVVDSVTVKGGKYDPEARGLTTSGVFGPILGTVLVDASQGKLVWNRWELGTAGPQAVFRFAIPREKSHYEVTFCCVAEDHGGGVFKQYAGYHGTIAVDPVSGFILRLTLEADFSQTDPLVRSDILVEYGPVEIGGKTYNCPVRSVSITLAPALPANAFEMQRYRGGLLDKDNHAAGENLQTLLNDVVFANYHLFRAESRILTGDSAEPDRNHPISNSAEPNDAAPIANAGTPVEAVAAEVNVAAELATPAMVSGPVPPPAPEPLTPEINVTALAGLPELPAASLTDSTNSSFTLRMTARLVDIGVVAFDKKGHPVMDLKPEDFAIYDNGRKQAVRFFSQLGGTEAQETSHAQGQPEAAPNQPTFSNRRADIADAKPGTGAGQGSTTILLIDAGNVGWSDLVYARGEMLRFLRSLPANELVGLYVMNAQSFQVLVEGTIDHRLLESKLRQWIPSAQDLARGREMEQRNRQQFDYVLHPSDLQSVNGNTSNAPETAALVDPQLRDFGSNPARNAMALMVGVARHLAAIPGHKNLVWVSSDNVLADWTDKEVNSERNGKQTESFVLRAQEALNDAHVSIYPLDASQLETMAIDPSVKSRNIELAPSVTAPPPPQGGGAAPGRIAAEMQQDLHPIQSAIQEMAEATGGRAFRRSGDIATSLNAVVADGRAEYLIAFTPDMPADDRYHLLTVKLAGRRGDKLRYRTGYQYAKEPASLKERFQQAIWQSIDASEIAVSANPVAASTGATLKLTIATNDLALREQGEEWVDKLDIFLILRDDEGLHARVTGQTLRLTLKPATYARLLRDGIPFEQFIEKKPETGTLRMVVVDENSGRMGSVTLPSAALKGKS